MPIDYIILPEIDLCYARWSGDLTHEDIVENFRRYVQDPLYRVGRPELVDLCAVKDLVVDMATMRNLLSRVNAQPFSPEGGTLTVILADNAVSFGHARQYQTLASIQGGIDVRLHRDERAALSDLGRPETGIAELLASHAPGWRGC